MRLTARRPGKKEKLRTRLRLQRVVHKKNKLKATGVIMLGDEWKQSQDPRPRWLFERFFDSRDIIPIKLTLKNGKLVIKEKLHWLSLEWLADKFIFSFKDPTFDYQVKARKASKRIKIELDKR